MEKRSKVAPAEVRVLIHAALIALVTYFVMFALLSAAITPQRYDIHVGAPASVTIYANEDVVDQVTTDQLREEAAARVDVSYKSLDESVLGEVTAELNALCSRMLSFAALEAEADDLGRGSVPVAA